MLRFICIVLFVISMALTAGSIVLAAQLRSKYKLKFLSSLLFYQVFYFTFGAYAIWGQIITGQLIATLIEIEQIDKIVQIVLLLGLPFIILTAVMSIHFSHELAGTKTGIVFSTVFITLNGIIILAFGFLMARRNEFDIQIGLRYYFMVLLSFYMVYNSTYLFAVKKPKTVLPIIDLRRIGFIFLFSFTSLLLPLLFYGESVYPGLIFVFFYFLTGTFIPVYLRYASGLSGCTAKSDSQISFEGFCRQYNITRREAEVIEQICLGHTNQQIADKLFISLQTVKDHTHRIYFKAECQNRSQLIARVNSLK